MLDLRRIRVGIEIFGRINWYEGLKVKATGTKYASPQQNDCAITITGLNQQTRQFILTETSPYNDNRTPKRLFLEVGRQKTGLFRLFSGDIVSAEPGPPPDNVLTIKAMTGNSNAGVILSRSTGPLAPLSTIARQVASDLGLSLVFEAVDKQIGGYSFTGPAIKQIQKLQEAGGVSAFQDDGLLVVKNRAESLAGKIRILNKNSGMVGIPKATDKGLKVSFLINGEAALGGKLMLDSKLNMSLNGDYIIDQLGFEVSSHDDPFFFNALASKL